jgi:hypothetical protein
MIITIRSEIINTTIDGQRLLIMEHNRIKEFNTEYQGTDPYILFRGLRWIKYRNACIRTSTTREYTWEIRGHVDMLESNHQISE